MSFSAEGDHEPDSTHRTQGAAAASSAATAIGTTNPKVSPRPVTDPAVLDQGRLFSEVHRQAQPLTDVGSTGLPGIVPIVRDGSARKYGISAEKAEGYATSPRPPASLLQGPHPKGKAAEVVAISDYRMLHDGADPGIINPPKHIAGNVADIRLSPDNYSCKDLLFGFQTKNGHVLWKYNGQVKTGSGTYITESLVKMTQTDGYGKVGYVDARFVNTDGSPKVGPDAFTPFQARQLQDANVELRGIPDLEKRATLLLKNIAASQQDSLDPVARKQLEQLRDDIAAAYRAKGVAGRLAGGVAIGAASAALVSIVMQLATDGRVDAKAVGHSVGAGAAFGIGGAAADAGMYHLATKSLGMLPEAAKDLAQQGVAGGFCLVAAGADVFSEIRAADSGELTALEAVCGSAAKATLDLLPLLLAPLGLVSLPILIGAQIGGRYLLAKMRCSDRALREAAVEDRPLIDGIKRRLAAFDETAQSIETRSAEIRQLYSRMMQGDRANQVPRLRLV